MSKYSLSKDKIRILLLEGVHKSAVETLEANGYTNIEYLKTSLPEDELIEKIKDVLWMAAQPVQSPPAIYEIFMFLCIGNVQ